MSLASFSIVLVGDNFPVPNINVSDFEFNHRLLKETLRLPMVVQAQARGVSIQVLPERFEATVTAPVSPQEGAERLIEMTNGIFDYVGPKSIKAVGHNAQYLVEGTEGRKQEISLSLLDRDLSQGALGVPLIDTDVHLYFKAQSGSKGRMAFLTETDNPMTALDFNINFDIGGSGSAREAVSAFPESLREIEEIAQRVEAVLSAERVK
ncbi:hypothetical protein [Nocardia brasiliensis]